MIKQIRTSKATKVIACYLAIMIFLQIAQPAAMYALTGGPSQPEFEAFTPIGTSDMVDLASGDFNYNIPVMDVGGYPINLAYNSIATMDQEASWVGLGWDMNVGQINRQMRGLPDDFNGDPITYENNMKENVTVGANLGGFVAGFGIGEASLNVNVGIGVKYNNYNGLGCSVNGGLGVQIGQALQVGMQMESSAEEGVSISPSLSFNKKISDAQGAEYDTKRSLGVSMNSRKGVESATLSYSAKKSELSKGVNGGALSYTRSFAQTSFTPTKRVAMNSSNYMFNLNIEGELWGVEPGVKFSGYRISQGIKESEKHKIEKGYGYENMDNASTADILDFNREKDRTFNKNTSSLPITNNTYDLYSIQGQGISGMFRPYKSQVSYVYDNKVVDASNGGNLGLEFGPAVHWGFDATVTLGKSRTELWDSGNPALSRFINKKTGNPIDYENVYFKNIGGFHADKEMDLFDKMAGKYEPLKFNLDGSKFSRLTTLEYAAKSDGNVINQRGIIKREKRVPRNQSIEKYTKAEALKYRLKTELSPFAQNNHTAEIKVTKEGGERYIYGRAVYNTLKKETTFDVGTTMPECETGLVSYIPGQDNSARNKQTGDQYFNRVTTPAYAHAYLLTAVLSSDYQDLKPDGPSDNDLGSYTQFEYDNKTTTDLYKWRVPFTKARANYDEGLKSDNKDNKGNYQYGEKELLYIKKIVTKTHVAVFHTSERLDAYGVIGEDGGLGDKSKMYKLDKISLYSKPEYDAHGEEATPIKEAHFKYDYSLCQGIENHKHYNQNGHIGQRGKLTLNKVYFTYKKSNMGKFTPYVFDYGADDPQLNPDYHLKAYDIWGNYKPLSTGCTVFEPLSNAEYPYVDQGSQNRVAIDKQASVWMLRAIKLPSGGTINVDYESDDYSHVQNMEAMQMFKVVGAGPTADISASSIIKELPLYENDPYKYLYIKLNEDIQAKESSDPGYFKRNYIKTLMENPIYFRFLLNMAKPGTSGGKYDYVTGYLELDEQSFGFKDNYVAVPIKFDRQGDGANKDKKVSPVSKAGWYFGRQYLSRLVYGAEEDSDTANLENIVKQLVNAVQRIGDIFKSGNGKLREQGTAKYFITEKSWIRLMQPDGKKLGGGSRVKEISMSDSWNVMTNNQSNPSVEQFYGQRYGYEKDGISSGVASYEPIGSKENPFVKPFYDEKKKTLLLAPEEQNYVELPFGESFFPSPKITYSQVSVQNLPRVKDNGNMVVKRHATGKVVTEFYTTRDYPTTTDYTVPSAHYDKTGVLGSLLNIKTKDYLTMTQGYVVHTNDMDGKMKSQKVYAEGQPGPISGVEYKYSENLQSSNQNEGKLNNYVKTISPSGRIETNLIGVEYDIVNDFRHNRSLTETFGIHFNSAGMFFGMLFVVAPTPLPSYHVYDSQINTAVTTKVIHTSGILVETIAHDAGSQVSTKNLAWDSETGSILVTETVNEYNDNYYSFNFPAFWAYPAMGQAMNNAGLEVDIVSEVGQKYKIANTGLSIHKYLSDGDEIFINGKNALGKNRNMKAWVVKSGNSFQLIDQNGLLIIQDSLKEGKAKVLRSSFRNMQNASMSTVSMMKNPLKSLTGTYLEALPNNPFSYSDIANGYRVINASAITYNDLWPAQCECDLPKMTYRLDIIGEVPVYEYENYESNVMSDAEPEHILQRSYNPYVYNILGNWRADKSYAYLTGRNFTIPQTQIGQSIDPVLRKTGFFNNYNPFYVRGIDGKWRMGSLANRINWQYASEVTQFSPYGQEVENKDALERYSSAYYGYNNRFPMAVASNTKYSELGYDGFEDYDFTKCTTAPHFNFQDQLNGQSVMVSSQQAHTGKRSLRVNAGHKAVLRKQVAPCQSLLQLEQAPDSILQAKVQQKPKVNHPKAIKKPTAVKTAKKNK